MQASSQSIILAEHSKITGLSASPASKIQYFHCRHFTRQKYEKSRQGNDFMNKKRLDNLAETYGCFKEFIHEQLHSKSS